MGWPVFVIFSLLCLGTIVLVRLVISWEEADRQATLEERVEVPADGRGARNRG